MTHSDNSPALGWLSTSGLLNKQRLDRMFEACDLFAKLYFAPCPRVAVENPVMHKYARIHLLNTYNIPSHSFTVQPWQFGVPETKRSCFWTRGLPPLQPTLLVQGRFPKVHRASPNPNRWKLRSRTLPQIAHAIALQYSSPTSNLP